jgi:hypothetical protein
MYIYQKHMFDLRDINQNKNPTYILVFKSKKQ